jgi:hypothetical protein
LLLVPGFNPLWTEKGWIKILNGDDQKSETNNAKHGITFEEARNLGDRALMNILLLEGKRCDMSLSEN